MTYVKRPEHNSDNYLKAILESIEYYNAVERLDISNWLLVGYKVALKDPNKRASRKAIVLELISKWIQELEDLAILCIMFAGIDIKLKGKPIIAAGLLPFEIYSYVSNQSVLKFYSISKKGLNKKSIAKIYAIKSAEEFYREKIINKDELNYFKVEINELIKVARGNFNRLGQIYFKGKRYLKNEYLYGDIVNTYFATKHGFKVIQPTETAKLLWKFNDDDIVLVKGTSILRSGRKIMGVGVYRQFKDEEIDLLIDKIKGWSEVIKEITGAHLRRLENQNYLVPMIRKNKTEQFMKNISYKIGRNDPCPCKSGFKYKKCCGILIEN